MAVPFQMKNRYTMADLLAIMACLRAPGGCPWDREQTHQSIRTDFLEETYEAIEAINNGDDAALLEELGDVLLQVVFHAQIAQEQGAFTFDDVADGICKKLVQRHPHVFGEVKADTAGQVLQNWDLIKRKTKGGASQADLLRSVPHAMPALTRAAKVQNRAKRVGVDLTPEQEQAGRQQCRDAWEQALAAGDAAAAEEACGRWLFAQVCRARQAGLDPELCLTRATDAFIARFADAERQTVPGGDWAACTEEQRRQIGEASYSLSMRRGSADI